MMIKFTKFNSDGEITTVGSFSPQNQEVFELNEDMDFVIYEYSNPATQMVDVNTKQLIDKPQEET